ncbi:hypothetical protein LMH87_006952 [Akanthomyces muscarius]|uniref:Uncharacterized protein n=1 Tax=Akanthomyces muscarius TaxID=2231603 RepID=A0A9W8QNS2_AKAMU|nr:hypothetical protein LMH87_006952 [Akanthomyces muscarius]KAJ4165316.1 hypothetical protein LMH87_006952 [Akanthomyces muscarius]
MWATELPRKRRGRPSVAIARKVALISWVGVGTARPDKMLMKLTVAVADKSAVAIRRQAPGLPFTEARALKTVQAHQQGWACLAGLEAPANFCQSQVFFAQ